MARGRRAAWRVPAAGAARLGGDGPHVPRLRPRPGRPPGRAQAHPARARRARRWPGSSTPTSSRSTPRPSSPARPAALCMPYLGGASLDRVLDELRSRPGGVDGRAIIDAIDRASEGLPVAVDSSGPARRLLATLAYPEAIAWIAACLADALDAAHGRGLVHMDVKPANVLLAADGTPMLLDFHLARPPVVPGKHPGAIGGTPNTMAPEHAPRWRPWRGPRVRTPSTAAPISTPWAGRSTRPSTSPAARESVSPGLRAIVARCLEIDPADRYADAASLGDDLRRHLNDLPLRGARRSEPPRAVGEVAAAEPAGLAQACTAGRGRGGDRRAGGAGAGPAGSGRGDLIEARDALVQAGSTTPAASPTTGSTGSAAGPATRHCGPGWSRPEGSRMARACRPAQRWPTRCASPRGGRLVVGARPAPGLASAAP